jgi:hypothetical protein
MVMSERRRKLGMQRGEKFLMSDWRSMESILKYAEKNKNLN